jgi:hypothetical protein
MRLFQTLLFSLLISVHAGTVLAEQQAAIPKPLAIPEPNEAVDKLCKAISGALADNGDKLQKKLGRAEKLEEIPMPNRHHPDTNDLRVMYHYKDGLVSFYNVPSMDKTYLEAAVLTKGFWPKGIPRFLGKSRDDIKGQFGKPDEEDNDRVAYTCSYETNDSVNFLMKKDKVYRVVLRNFIE